MLDTAILINPVIITYEVANDAASKSNTNHLLLLGFGEVAVST